MNALVVYLLVGLAVGLVVPLVAGRQALGWVGTCLLGAVGAFIGGVLGSYDMAAEGFMVVRSAGVLHAAIGAVVTVVLVLAAKERPAARPTMKLKGWSDGLLASDHRSFETISKRHQRSN